MGLENVPNYAKSCTYQSMQKMIRLNSKIGKRKVQEVPQSQAPALDLINYRSKHCPKHYKAGGGWAKVLCILRHQGIQLRLAYSWARPAILAVGKGRGRKVITFLFLPFHSFSSLPCSLFHLYYYSFSVLPFSGR